MSIRVKRGKLGSWNSQNPTLDDGQLGVVRMTDGSWSLKVGDGSSRFANLQYISALPMIQELSQVNWNSLKSSGLYSVTSSASTTGAPNGATKTSQYTLSITQGGGSMVGQVVVPLEPSPVTGKTVAQARQYDGSSWGEWKYLSDDLQFTDWKEVSSLVKSGRASSVLHVGDRLSCTHSRYGKLEWIIVDFDKEVSDSPHSMTLWLSKALPNEKFQYDTQNHVVMTDAAITYWLNSDQSNWYSSCSSQASTAMKAIPGFLSGFTPDFISALGSGVYVMYAKIHSSSSFNDYTQSPPLRVWNLAGGEINQNYGDYTYITQYQYFSLIQEVDDFAARALLADQSGYGYWLRTPNSPGSTTGTMRVITAAGLLQDSTPTTSINISVRPLVAIL